MTNPAAPPSTQRLVRSFLVVALGFLLTKGVSFIQTVIIADRIGAGAEFDTFAAGSLMPDYIVRLIGGGALGVAFIPVLSALLNNDDSDGAWKLASQVFNSILIAALALSIVVMIFAQPIVENVVASGFDAEQTAQTADLMRILALASVLFSISGVISGVLHGHNHFFLPVLAPIFQDLGLLFGVVFFIDSMGVYGLAWGTLLGAVLHLGIQLPGLVIFRAQWKPMLGWNDPQLRHVIRLMLPRIGIAVAFLINLTVFTDLNSRMGEGAVSAFSWALRFIDIPQALIGTAIGVVIFPTLSALSSMNKVEERRIAFSSAMRFILVASLPATVGLVLTSNDALRLLFTVEESARIYTAIQVMSLAIIFQSLHEVLTRAFYAQQDTVRPLIYSVVSTVITVTSVILAYQVYLAEQPPLWSPLAVGIPAAGYVLSFLVEITLLSWFLRQRWGDIGLGVIRASAGRALLATFTMWVAILVVRQLLLAVGFDSYGAADIIIRIAAEVGVGVLVWLGMAWLIGLQELRELLSFARDRLKRA